VELEHLWSRPSAEAERRSIEELRVMEAHSIFAMALYREMGMRHWLEEAEALDPETR
jgi:hypothetical protein